MLPTVDDPAVLELEDDRVPDVQVLAVSVSGTAMDADDVAVIVRGQVLQLGAEGAACLLRQLAEIRQRRVAALVIVGERAPPRQVPHGALVEQLGERVDVTRVECLVSAPHDRDVFICAHRLPPDTALGDQPGAWSRVDTPAESNEVDPSPRRPRAHYTRLKERLARWADAASEIRHAGVRKSVEWNLETGRRTGIAAGADHGAID